MNNLDLSIFSVADYKYFWKELHEILMNYGFSVAEELDFFPDEIHMQINDGDWSAGAIGSDTGDMYIYKEKDDLVYRGHYDQEIINNIIELYNDLKG